MLKLLWLPALITTLALVFKHNVKRTRPSNKETVNSYLAREEAANSVRRKDISDLPFIEVPFDTLPLDITLNDTKKQLQIEKYQKDIRSFSNRQMLNLIGVSNTELKERYGVANLDKLMTFDQNYSSYLRSLQLYASAIFEEHPDAAVSIMEYSIETGTDISETYDLLGKYYLTNGKRTDFNALYKKIPDKTSISGKVICNKLNRLLENSSL